MANNGTFKSQDSINSAQGQVVHSKKKLPAKVKLGLVLVSVVALFAMCRAADKHEKAKEQQAVDALNSRTEQTQQIGQDGEPQGTTPEDELSESEMHQRALVEVYGEAPQGFRWADDGELVPVSDEGLTDEEVAWQYLRALSMLDMETAQKYAYTSSIIPKYHDFYDTDASKSYYSQFQRKIFTKSLLALQIDSLDTKGVFANGRRVCTFTVTVLDLSYKDFWKDDSDSFFIELNAYLAGERDSTKGQQFIFDKILDFYESGECPTKTTQVDIVLDKVYKGGWLISDDNELRMLCEYTDGTSVYSYIMEEYNKWQVEQQRGY